MEDTSAGTILTFGILSLLCCPILFGPIAWIMGDKSLNLISSGRGNPNERGVVEAGRTLGMIGTALGILGLIIGAIRLASNN